MDDVLGLRVDLQDALDRSERWLRRLADVRFEGNAPAAGLQARLWADKSEISKLRSRAASSLINIAMLGGFSSGKSFLVSGLQGGLSLVKVRTKMGYSDQYIGLLPSAPTPTSACPASVIPCNADSDFDTADRGYLRVLFTDSEEWIDIGNSPKPQVVASYAMQEPELITYRRKEHWDREVAEIEILLSSYKLPAKLYDLPGNGSPNAMHDAVIRRAMIDADCFIYVANASRTLSESDLSLIRSLYEHHTHTGKPVLWVVTAIDLAMNLGLDGETLAWEATVARNKQYLEENFKLPDGRPDAGFIGQGFIGVSPALEARGEYLKTNEDGREAQECIAQSRMGELRVALSRLIETQTGSRHIARVASESRAIVAPRFRLVSEMLRSAKVPLDRLTIEREEFERRLNSVEELSDGITATLQRRLQQRLRAVDSSFRGLSAHLRSRLEQSIRSADLNDPTEVNRIEVEKAQVIHEWMASANGPSATWDTELRHFLKEIKLSLKSSLEDASGIEKLRDDADVDLDGIDIPKTQRSREETRDLLQGALTTAGVVTPVATTALAALGIVTGPLLAIPATVTIGVLAIATSRQRKARKTALELLREEWVEDLGQIAENVKQQFIAAASLRGMDVISRAGELVTRRKDEIVEALLLIDQRLADPEHSGKQQLILDLEPIAAEGEAIVADLTRLSRVAQAARV
ncbi:hypothetical protein [Nonomuraea sp. SYSU D8015]|uniref:hypothetical protein n=1 Tax=Nonomuraea sp. SYSU D8015 TaxID=2593644 RepID=UPI00166091E6|nr:hypothetical protein [Nonomuraea sp. SYSU D8015]